MKAITKTSVVKAFTKDFGYGKEYAEELIAKHIDIYEVNCKEEGQTAEAIAMAIDEEEMQHHDDEDFV